MKLKPRLVGVATISVLLTVLAVSHLQAQSSLTLEGLLERITALSSTVSTLGRNSATKDEVSVLEGRVETLEMALANMLPPAASALLQPRTTPIVAQTPTRPSATPLPRSEVPLVTVTRKTDVRRGPGGQYPLIDVAEVGEELDLTGKSFSGDWWRIDYKGKRAWIQAADVIAINVDRLVDIYTPTPLPTPTSEPTPEHGARRDGEGYVYELFMRDLRRSSWYQDWVNLDDEQRASFLDFRGFMLEIVAENCELPTKEMAIMINHYGQLLDDQGFTIRTEMFARLYLLQHLGISRSSETAEQSCESLLKEEVNRLLGFES